MRLTVIFVAGCLLLSGCATFDQMPARTKAGSKIGAILGGIGGAIADSDNPWRGAIVGSAAGAVVGGVIGNISDQAAKEAAARGETVRYSRTTDQGWQEEVIATPQQQEGNYKLISVKYIRDGKVIDEEIQKVPIN